MPTNSQLIGRFLRGDRLDEVEIQQIERALTDYDFAMERVQGWSDGKDLKVDRFTSVLSPDWQQSPLHAYTFQRNADLTVVHDTNTYVTFDYDAGESKFFQLDASDMTRLRVLRGGAAFLIIGYINWTSHATGYRKLHVEGFDSAGASLGNSPLYTLPGSSLVDNVTPVNYSSGWRQFPTLSFMKFFVYQSSGGDLVLKDLVLNIFVV
jgi:hypothetical protein